MSSQLQNFIDMNSKNPRAMNLKVLYQMLNVIAFEGKLPAVSSSMKLRWSCSRTKFGWAGTRGYSFGMKHTIAITACCAREGATQVMATMLHEMAHIKRRREGFVPKSNRAAHKEDFGDAVNTAGQKVIPHLSITAKVLEDIEHSWFRYRGTKTYPRPQLGLGQSAYVDQWDVRAAAVKPAPTHINFTMAANGKTIKVEKKTAPSIATSVGSTFMVNEDTSEFKTFFQTIIAGGTMGITVETTARYIAIKQNGKTIKFIDRKNGNILNVLGTRERPVGTTSKTKSIFNS